MPMLTIKNMPDEIYRRLKEEAAQNRRSLNSEILVRLERSVSERRARPEEVLARIERLNAGLNYPPLTGELLEKARSEGRP